MATELVSMGESCVKLHSQDESQISAELSGGAISCKLSFLLTNIKYLIVKCQSIREP